MSKRQHDTKRWSNRRFKKLPVEYKLLWLYINDDCEHTGMWEVEIDVAAARIGASLEEDEAKQHFEGMIEIVEGGDFWFIPSFVREQCGRLSINSNVHRSVMRNMIKCGIDIAEYIDPLIVPKINSIKEIRKYEAFARELCKHYPTLEAELKELGLQVSLTLAQPLPNGSLTVAEGISNGSLSLDQSLAQPLPKGVLRGKEIETEREIEIDVSFKGDCQGGLGDAGRVNITLEQYAQLEKLYSPAKAAILVQMLDDFLPNMKQPYSDHFAALQPTGTLAKKLKREFKQDQLKRLEGHPKQGIPAPAFLLQRHYGVPLWIALKLQDAAGITRLYARIDQALFVHGSTELGTQAHLEYVLASLENDQYEYPAGWKAETPHYFPSEIFADELRRHAEKQPAPPEEAPQSAAEIRKIIQQARARFQREAAQA